MKDLKVGDIVKVHDYSWAVRVDTFEINTSINKEDKHEVVGLNDEKLKTPYGDRVHDVFIKNMRNGKIFLHTERFTTRVEPPAKELTVAEISAKLGYTVKVVE